MSTGSNSDARANHPVSATRLDHREWTHVRADHPAEVDARPGVPRIVVAVAHPTMRRYLCELIEQNCRCWLATASPDPDELQAVLERLQPDVLVIDNAPRPANGNGHQPRIPAQQTLAIGPDRDPAYRAAAMEDGAGAWVSRDDLDTELVPELVRLLSHCDCGCDCGPPSSEGST